MPAYSYDLLPDAAVPDVESEEAVRVGSGLVQQTEHSAAALQRLIRYFSVGKPRIANFLSAFVDEVQSIEDLAWIWYATSRDLDTVEGVLLERLGAIVDEARNGRLDVDYRAAIRVKILVLSSDGKTEQLIAILEAMISGVTVAVTELWPAKLSIAVSTTGSLSLSYVKALLTLAKGGGVGLELGLAGGVLGDVDGDPLGGTLGDTDGSPLGFSLGLVA